MSDLDTKQPASLMIKNGMQTDEFGGRVWLGPTFHGSLLEMAQKFAALGAGDQANAMLIIARGFHLDGREIHTLIGEING